MRSFPCYEAEVCLCPPRLKECDVWGQCEVLRILQRYRPQSEDELFDILSLLDASLVSPHSPVMAATLSLFLSLCSGLPAVSLAALERVRGPLLAACGSVSREMRFAALCHIQVSVTESALCLTGCVRQILLLCHVYMFTTGILTSAVLEKNIFFSFCICVGGILWEPV